MQAQFPPQLMREWENGDGVDFAIALARATGWLLYVDWFAQSQDDAVEQMQSVRVYVGTDGDAIYDFNGKKRIQAYNQYVIQPILIKRNLIKGAGVSSRYYSEEKLLTLPLRKRPSADCIRRAEEALKINPAFLAKIPGRINLQIPAHLAAEFSFGKCVLFAAALEERTGLKATGISVSRYSAMYAGNELGFCHSVIIHPDGQWEDSWGKQPMDNILERFGIEAYTLSSDTHQQALSQLRKNSPLEFERYFALAKDLLLLS